MEETNVQITLLSYCYSHGMKDFFGNIGMKNFNLKGVVSMAMKAAGGLGNNPLQSALSKVNNSISWARNMIKHPPLGALKSLAIGGIGRLLSSRGIMSALPVGGLALPSLGQGCSGSGLGSWLQDLAMKAGGNRLESLQGTGQLGSLFGQHGQQGSGFLFGLTSQMSSFGSGSLGMMTAFKSKT